MDNRTRILAVACLLPATFMSMGCSRRTAEELEASRARLLVDVQNGKARWSWSEELGEESRAHAALESFLRPAVNLSVMFDDWWLEQEASGRTELHFMTLSMAGNDPEFGSVEVRWIVDQPELERVRDTLLGAVREDFAGVPIGDPPLQAKHAMDAKGAASLLIRRDLEQGSLDEALECLTALHRTAEWWMAREGVESSLVGAFQLEMRFIRDELSRIERTASWERADAERIQALTVRAVSLLKPDLRPLRWEFWHAIDGRVTEARTGSKSREIAHAVDVASSFAGREAAIVETLKMILERPLLRADAAAKQFAQGVDKDSLDHSYWMSVHTYLSSLMTVRSELETLQFVLQCSLDGELETGRTSRGYFLQASTVGAFVIGVEDGGDDSDAWTVKVPRSTIFDLPGDNGSMTDVLR